MLGYGPWGMQGQGRHLICPEEKFEVQWKTQTGCVIHYLADLYSQFLGGIL